MATPGSSPLADLQTAYAGVCAQIRDVLCNPKPNYTVDGVSVDRQSFYASLMAREKELRAVAGVAPSTAPVFEVFG